MAKAFLVETIKAKTIVAVMVQSLRTAPYARPRHKKSKPYFAADLVAVIAVQTSRILDTLPGFRLLPSRPE